MMPRLALTWRWAWMLARCDRRSGDWRMLAAALVVAVAALASVGGVVERAALALMQRAQQAMGADLVVVSDHDGLQAFELEARQRGLQVARTLSFPSMVRRVSAHAAPSVLVSVKAVSEHYPLRGAVRISAQRLADDAPAQEPPKPSTVWLDPAAMQTLGVQAGDAVQLGDSVLTVTHALTLEPDRSLSFINFAPRLMFAWSDVPATGLLQEGSRASWRLLVAGDALAVQQYEHWVRTRLDRGQKLESTQQARPELTFILERGQRVMGLVAVLAALLAAVAMALAARRFALRHSESCAVLRALGMTRRQLLAVLLLELAWVGVVAGGLGVVLGAMGQAALAAWLGPWLGGEWPAGSLAPSWRAWGAGLLMLAGFAAPPFVRLAAVPPWRALRRDTRGHPLAQALSMVLALVSSAAVIMMFAHERQLGLLVLGAYAGALVTFVLLSSLWLLLCGRVRRTAWARPQAVSLSLALASLQRHRVSAVVQMVALALGMMALVLLTLTRQDLLDRWQQALPAHAPNRFIINIQADQRQPLLTHLQERGLGPVALYPMVRGRLIAINGQAVDPTRPAQARAQRLLDREFNLSYFETPQPDTPIATGRWLNPAAAEVSVEAGVLRTLGLNLGDWLTFEIAGEPLSVRIVGTRKVRWDTMKPNFFMVLSPAVMLDRPQSWMTALHVPDDDPIGLHDVMARMPHLTVIDTSAVLRQVRHTLDQSVRVLSVLFALTLLAGVVVVVAALSSTRDERLAQAALLRALGATRAQLRRAHLIELTILGAAAGLMAGGVALVMGAVLAVQVFEWPYTPRWWGLPVCTLAGVCLAVVAGGWGLRRVLTQPPLRTLRAG